MDIHGRRLVFVLLQCFAVQILAQNQSAFLSLDCGLAPRDSSYRERTTNLTYISDANFINTGESRSIKNDYRSALQQQTWTLRSFPRGIRNCYQMNLTKGVRYLIKATFVYGNYDDRDEPPEFDLYLGTNFWTTVSITNASTASMGELVHLLSTNRLHICLVKSGRTTPFISSLEIRPLRNGTYVGQSGALMTLGRRYIGSADDPGFIRFPEDVRDRAWVSTIENDWTRLATTNSVNNTESGYDVPQRALRVAATPTNATLPFNLSFPLPPGLLIYVYFHFAETQVLKANESRGFNITYNGNSWLDYFSPTYLAATSFYSPVALGQKDGKYEFIIQKAENSTHPPIINAYEVYTVVDLSQPETDENDVNAITGIKTVYGLNRDSWQGDPCAPQNYSWDGLNCSYKELSPPRITSLNLSANGLTGEITNLISNLTQLSVLDLSNNNLTGGVPDFLVRLTSLEVLNLSRNQLTGSVPNDLIERTRTGTLTLSLQGNLGLCETNACNNGNKKKKKNRAVVPVVVSLVLVLILAAAVAVLLICKGRNQRSTEGRTVDKETMQRHGPSYVPTPFETTDRRFLYPDVVKMTNNFERILGRGGFGVVYHGCLNGDQVAVKLLDETSAQGYKQFKAEVELLLRVHHKDLVSLVGYCDDGPNLALIYEIMANRDLKEHLSGKHGDNVLNWEDRLRIASEAATGLEYLHHGCKPPIVHRDVKTTNILLNEDFQAKLADFGLSRSFLGESETHVSTIVAGTPGFLDPEYCKSNWLTEKSDVYSFGVVLLEIVTNRPVIDQTREKVHLGDWAKVMVRGGDIGKIVDPRLQAEFSTNSAWKFVEVALACVSQSSSERPSMTLVVMELNECLALERARKQGSQTMNSNDSMLFVGSENSFSTELMPRAR